MYSNLIVNRTEKSHFREGMVMVSARTNGEYEQRALRPPKAGESPSPAWRWPAAGAGAHTPAHGRSSKGREREIGRKGRTTESNTAAV